MPRLPSFSDTGFSLYPRQGARSLVIGLGAGLAFGGWMALADSIFFASVVPPSQHVVLASTTPLERIAGFARGALGDEIALRLITMTALVWLLMAVTKRRGSGVYWAAIGPTAFVAWPLWASGYVTSLDWSALTVLREVALHGAAGTLWGWLCWRHGWLAGLTGHIGAHLALQPLLALTA